jgi:hypothetical protein
VLVKLRAPVLVVPCRWYHQQRPDAVLRMTSTGCLPPGPPAEESLGISGLLLPRRVNALRFTGIEVLAGFAVAADALLRFLLEGPSMQAVALARLRLLVDTALTADTGPTDLTGKIFSSTLSSSASSSWYGKSESDMVATFGHPPPCTIRHADAPKHQESSFTSTQIYARATASLCTACGAL